MDVVSEETIIVRRVASADLPALREIYADVVGTLGPAAYTPAQVDAWKAFARQAEFDDFILGVNTYVAEIGAEIAGFCGIAGDGHVASVYIAPERCGQGIGTTLLRQVLARHPAPSSGQYYAEASLFSLPLFRRCGFRQTGREHAVRDGVAFERFLVARAVEADDPTNRRAGRV